MEREKEWRIEVERYKEIYIHRAGAYSEIKLEQVRNPGFFLGGGGRIRFKDDII